MSVPTVSPINQMLAAGPDKYSNQFSIFISRVPRESYTSMASDSTAPQFNTSWLVLQTTISEDSVTPLNTLSDSIQSRMQNLLDVSENSQDIKVRAIDIEIPLPKYNNFQTPYYNTQVERTSTKMTYANKSVLNIELDNSLNYLDAFQTLAGHINSKDIYADYRHIDNPKAYIYNIYVVSNPLKSDADYIDSQTPLYYWEFYDCKFLGNENEIKFEKSSNIVTGSFPFIFFDCRAKFGG